MISWPNWLLHFIQKRLFPSLQAKFGAAAKPRQNPFASLKMGKKIIVIAAIDSGNVSFFRFGQGGFEEWPML
jgi:tRNA-splicing endonuclease subunit Sen54